MAFPSKSEIYFFYKVPLHLKNRTSLKNFLKRIFRTEGKKLESLNYVFCSDSELLQINRKFLQHNYYTDIITFELSAPGLPVMAEIYISIDRVKENSRKLEETFTKEIHRVIFHGALHLCGYKDKTKAESEKMREKENYYLNQYFG